MHLSYQYGKFLHWDKVTILLIKCFVLRMEIYLSSQA